MSTRTGYTLLLSAVSFALVTSACQDTPAPKSAKASAASSMQPQAKLLAPGAPAPKIALLAHTGKVVGLDAYKGRKVLLWFYPKASTGG